MFFKDNGVKEDELQAILNYLLTMHEVTWILYVGILFFEVILWVFLNKKELKNSLINDVTMPVPVLRMESKCI